MKLVQKYLKETIDLYEEKSFSYYFLCSENTDGINYNVTFLDLKIASFYSSLFIQICKKEAI